MKYVHRVAQVVFWVLLLSSAAIAHSLMVFDVPFGAPFNNFFHTEARGLNNRGQIVGMYRTFGAGGRGFLYERGVFTTIYVPHSFGTMAYKINDRGALVGTFTDPSGSHGFRYDGLYATIDVPFVPEGHTQAFGINNYGQIVGSFQEGETEHAFLYQKGHFTSFDFHNSMLTTAFAINDKGLIVGSFNDGVQTRSFLYDDGVFTSLNIPFAQNSGDEALGINDRGDIVGRYTAPDDTLGSVRVSHHGYIYSQGTFLTFDIPQGVPFLGRFDTQVWDINDRAEYVGTFFTTGNSAYSGFLASINRRHQ